MTYANQLNRTHALLEYLQEMMKQTLSIAQQVHALELKENTDEGLTSDEEHLLNVLWELMEERLSKLDDEVGMSDLEQKVDGYVAKLQDAAKEAA